MKYKKLSIYESLELHPPEISECSRLYSLEPIGIGTPDCESLTSYIIRLSQAHCVTVNKLLHPNILKDFDRKDLSDYSQIIYRLLRSPHNSKSFNGLGLISTKLSQQLEALTLRNDLSFLTMLSWSEITTYHQLFRDHQAWCPVCYEEWQTNKKPLYIPLLWFLEPVKICLHHYQYLLEQCPHCRQTLPIIGKQMQLGYCSHCGNWLGSSSLIQTYHQTIYKDNIKWQEYVTISMGELIAAAPHLSSLPTRDRTAQVLNTYLNANNISKGEIATFTRFIGVRSENILIYLYNKRVPRIDKLLQITFALQTSPLKFFTEDINTLIGKLKVSSQLFVKVKEQDDKPKPTKLDKIKIRQVLTQALLEEVPPSITEVAKRLKCSRHSIKYYCPELYQALQIHRRTERLKNSNQYSLEIRSFLEAALIVNPPPSMQSLTKSLPIKSAKLYKLFPELCYQISKRYKEYRNACTLEKRNQVIHEMNEAISKLHNQGKEPTLAQVRKLLTKPGYTREQFFQDALFKTRQELGYEN